MTKKITKNRLKWYGHGDEGHTLRRMLDAPVPGKERKTENQVETREKEIWKV